MLKPLHVLCVCRHTMSDSCRSRSKLPEFHLSGNVSENWKNFETRFQDYAISAGYRDCNKDPPDPEHWLPDKRQLEISSLRLCLPDDTLSLMRYSIEPDILPTDKKKPWIWLAKLRLHYTGAAGSTKLTDRFNFSALSQTAGEAVTVMGGPCSACWSPL